MFLSYWDFPLACPVLQKRLFTVCMVSAKYKWYIMIIPLFRTKFAPKDDNHSLSKQKNYLATIHTSASFEKNVNKFGSIYVEEF